MLTDDRYSNYLGTDSQQDSNDTLKHAAEVHISLIDIYISVSKLVHEQITSDFIRESLQDHIGILQDEKAEYATQLIPKFGPQ